MPDYTGGIAKMAAVTAIAAAAVAGPAVGHAHASTVRPMSCGYWENIGQPGNLYVWNQYAGQVEQQFYVPCSGSGVVRAHWQWSGTFQANHGGMVVHVGLFDNNGGDHGSFSSGSTSSKDVYSYNIDVHAANPDEYEAIAYGDGVSGTFAEGSLHWYYNGQDLQGPSDGHMY